MEIIVKIDKRSKQAKAFYEYLKTLPFVEIGIVSDKPETNVPQDQIVEISKAVNQAGAKKWFDKLGIDYGSYS